MTFQEFDQFFDRIFEECKFLRDTKGKEYAHSTSRFANFDRAAERLGISRTMVANVYLHKHLDAIDSYILNRESYSGENIRGRITDAITYLCLVAGMIEEDIDGSGAERPPLKTNSIICKPGESMRYIGPTIGNSLDSLIFGQTVTIINLEGNFAKVTSEATGDRQWLVKLWELSKVIG